MRKLVPTFNFQAKILGSSIRFLIKVGVPILSVYLIIHKINLQKTLQVISDVDWVLVVSSSGLMLLALGIYVWRLKAMLETYGTHHDSREVLSLHLVSSFASLFLPGNLGSFVLAFYLREDGYPFRRAVLIVLLKQFFDLATVIIFGLVSLLFLPDMFHLGWRPVGFLLVIYSIAIGLVVLFWRRAGKVLLSAIDYYLRGRMGKIFKLDLREVYADLRQFTLRRIAYVGVLSLATTLVEICAQYLMTLALHTRLPFMSVMACISVASIVAALPISIGGLGPREGALVYLFSALGENPEIAAAFSVLLLLNILSLRFGGMLVWITHPPSFNLQTTNT